MGISLEINKNECGRQLGDNQSYSANHLNHHTVCYSCISVIVSIFCKIDNECVVSLMNAVWRYDILNTEMYSS